jgi:hypothetical protein
MEAPPEPPTLDDAMDLDYDITAISGNGRNKVESGDESFLWTANRQFSNINVSSDGIIATIPEIEKRYYYEDYVTAIIVPTGDAGRQELADQLGAVIADEFPQKLLVFLPRGSEPSLDALVEGGRISSYEIGGWGTGLGKA